MDFPDISYLWKELIPGIPNDITLHEIATKLSWRGTHTLSSVSSLWQQGIQKRVVYDTRVHCHSTETLAVLEIFNKLFLYSLRDKTLSSLPPTPVRRPHEFVAMNGKLYLLGGVRRGHHHPDSKNVHVLDLAAQGKWKQCASMLSRRLYFACGIMDGKIYVFGGADDHAPSDHASEMYDPKVNTWFRIKPMPQMKVPRSVTCVGDELFVQNGIGFASSWQAYHPLKDEWRAVEPFRVDGFVYQSIFIRQDKFYSTRLGDLRVYDTEKQLWTHICSISCDELGPVGSLNIDPYFILPVGNELLAMVSWHWREARNEGMCLLESSGFGSENKEVVWSKAPHSFGPHDFALDFRVGFMCVAEL